MKGVVQMKLDSVDWILQHGCVVTPDPDNVLALQTRMLKLALGLEAT
jgi:hypothetical protein